MAQSAQAMPDIPQPMTIVEPREQTGRPIETPCLTWQRRTHERRNNRALALQDIDGKIVIFEHDFVCLCKQAITMLGPAGIAKRAGAKPVWQHDQIGAKTQDRASLDVPAAVD